MRLSADPLLDVRDLSVEFRRRDGFVPVVSSLSYRLLQGRTLAIIGESGAGKSVSCKALLGLLPPSARASGSVRLAGKALLDLPEREMRRHRGADIAIAFQDAARQLNPTMRIGEQIAEAVRAHEPVGRAAARKLAVDLLGRLGVPTPRRRFLEYPHQLSGGMRQRVMIAIAIAGNPKVLIGDEITSAVDPLTRAGVMELLVDLQRELDMGLIMVSHDLGLVAGFADEIIVMQGGKAIEQGAAERLLTDPRAAYTRALLEAAPRLRSRRTACRSPVFDDEVMP